MMKVRWLLILAIIFVAGNGYAQSIKDSWEYKSQAAIVKVQPLSDGGAFIWTSRETDGQALPGKNTVYRINPDGSVAWKYVPLAGYTVSFLDSTSDGKYSLVSTYLAGPGVRTMTLLLLDNAGQVISERGPLEDSNWVWLSPDGRSVLRWINSEYGLVLEDSKSGKKEWGLDPVAAHVIRESISFVEPAWASGCVLVGDYEHGNITAVGSDGRPLWKIRNLRWYAPANNPILMSSSGDWMMIYSAKKPAPETSSDKDIEYYAYNAGGLARRTANDEMKLMKIKMNGDTPGQQEQANIVWERAISSSIIAEGKFPTRTGLGGGTVISTDLIDGKKDGGPYLAMATGSSISVLQFDRDGSLIREAAWPVSDVAGIYGVWLASPSQLVVRRPKTKTSPETVQVLDQTGSVLWEKKLAEAGSYVHFDDSRKYVVVSTSHTVTCYRVGH